MKTTIYTDMICADAKFTGVLTSGTSWKWDLEMHFAGIGKQTIYDLSFEKLYTVKLLVWCANADRRYFRQDFYAAGPGRL